ncbi:DUF4232 domain-containing protein [Streptomyces sp. MUM 178J]|uniref:DUF4232 domain-containing protein n=1 Tax=Streptomyces sp. MUM 178J TaxID=2791991 RepID=UPI0027E38CEE|nr:DUF4232 domain-containing protein [Streptomyces sp. MUM 178J]WRQ82262.1 DUF4232 domain-containing protein [Streptomyces sp. MUM 178J]
MSPPQELPGDPEGLEKDGVRITGMSEAPRSGDPTPATVGFEVSNSEGESFTYTVTFSLVSQSGAVLSSTDHTVPSVGAGRTVAGTVSLDAMRPDGLDSVHARIAKVRRVPTEEAPAETGPCPASGVRITADGGDAAMGLRVVGLRLENCGTGGFRLDGYPLLEVLDEDRAPVSGVTVVRGSGGIATVTGFDDPPQPVTLKPGETASTGLMWRNTTEAGTPVNAPYVRVRTEPGSRPVMLTPELDLGTTGKLGVRPWKKDEPTR